MFEVVLYENRKGESQIRDYINDITQSNSKDSRIKFKRFNNCIVYLKMDGTRAGLPHIKHIDGEIWELRPGDDRVLFAAWIGNKFVLLHQFLKTTQKTPQSEIDQAKRELADWKERHPNDSDVSD